MYISQRRIRVECYLHVAVVLRVGKLSSCRCCHIGVKLFNDLPVIASWLHIRGAIDAIIHIRYKTSANHSIL